MIDDNKASGVISIHAAQEGCDLPADPAPRRVLHFNPRSPRGLRPISRRKSRISAYFNPRSPRGLRHEVARRLGRTTNFNPRSPRGLRRQQKEGLYLVIQFQSTQPKRAATVRPRLPSFSINISIHAAQEGCDDCGQSSNKHHCHFNPRSPRGLRHKLVDILAVLK